MPERTAAALVLEHERDTPAALLAGWAAQRGVELEVVAVADSPLPDPAGRPFVVSLGSEAAAYDDAVPWLAAERALLDAAIAAGVPVLGICFGAQHLARALGGQAGPLERPEVGWLEIDTRAPAVVPHGPWLQWHRDAFTVPPGARELARSPAGAQAFAQGPHLGVQFHPEVTPEVVAGWVRDYPDSITRAGTSAAAVLDGSVRHAAGARERAWALFDAFLASARAATPHDGPARGVADKAR